MKKDKKQSVKILIPNATSPRNIGDQAMLESLISLITVSFEKSNIRVHSVDSSLYKKTDYVVNDTLYSWSVLSVTNWTGRVCRVLWILFAYFILKLKLNFIKLLPSKLQEIIKDYENAHFIIFVGGGYLRSKKGLTQSLNLFMQLAPFIFCKLFDAKRIIAPISFGPFAYKWQEWLSAKVLNNFDLVSIREEVSFEILKKYSLSNVVLSSDHALLLNVNVKARKQRHDYFTIGFTVRNWGYRMQQEKLEDALIGTFEKVSEKMRIRIQPVVQVDAPRYGEADKEATLRLIKKLKKRHIKVLPMINGTSLYQLIKAYASLDLLVGMRMHSNILAAIQGTPFVAISYEHKTQGIAKQLFMEKYCVNCTDVNSENLYNLLVDAYHHRKNLKNNLKSCIKVIQYKEIKRWGQYLSNVN